MLRSRKTLRYSIYVILCKYNMSSQVFSFKALLCVAHEVVTSNLCGSFLYIFFYKELVRAIVLELFPESNLNFVRMLHS